MIILLALFGLLLIFTGLLFLIFLAKKIYKEIEEAADKDLRKRTIMFPFLVDFLDEVVTLGLTMILIGFVIVIMSIVKSH